ncbi:MAG TPA: phosphoribosylamine--glycine ligase, partial [Victivallales bacterium]|nr:phosphoribosylamine--glycine ligase [Victivallales bacterium]
MRVLVVGGGGREHAICWALAKSKIVDKLFCAPGNAGIKKIAECIDIQVEDIKSLAKFAKENFIDFTVVGPELPLCLGISDLFKENNLKIFGPEKNSAKLEGSKIFAKKFMKKYSIPTADFNVFDDRNKAINFLEDIFSSKKGIVIKADGLAAGKGVIIANTLEEAKEAVELCFGGQFGDAGRKILIEEMLYGEEASILALCDGKTIIPLASSQDHKRVGDGDSGPNTGGMGAYSPAPIVTEKLMAQIEKNIFDRFLRGIKSENMSYCGIIYAGIMVTNKGPMVLEFNVRFGDPETQAILPRLKTDLGELILRAIEQNLSGVNLIWEKHPAVSVVMASAGYPGTYQKGFEIDGLDDAENDGAIVFHAGTSFKDGKIVTSGGRVLAVTALGNTIEEAIEKSYNAVSKIKWKGCFYRKDIAKK